MSTDATSVRSTHEIVRRARGGTIVNVVVAIVFFGLIALGVLWVIKQTGQTTRQYGQALTDTTDKASAMKCRMNMRSIYQSLQVYALENETFPSSQQELVDYCGDSRLFRCSEPNAPIYVYVPGQRSDLPGTNVLLYEPTSVHEGRCCVLFVNGQTVLLTPAELEQALEATKANR